MIRAVFSRDAKGLCSAEISGHAGYREAGEDIVCASVTSAVQLVCNGVTEVLKIPAEVRVEENLVRLRLPGDACAGAAWLLEALLLHLRLLEQDYPQNLTTTVLEV